MEPVTVAENCCVVPESTLAVVGDTVTDVGIGAGVGIGVGVVGVVGEEVVVGGAAELAPHPVMTRRRPNAAAETSARLFKIDYSNVEISFVGCRTDDVSASAPE